MRTLRRREQGFSLVEIMIVVAVISILGSLFVQNGQSSLEETRAMACEKNRILCEDMEQRFYHDAGRPSVALAELVEAGLVNKANCPRGGVLAWTTNDPDLDYPHQALVCSIHGPKTRLRKWIEPAESAESELALSSSFSGGIAEGWTEAMGKRWQVTSDGRYLAGDPSRTVQGQHRSFSGDESWTDYDVSTKIELEKGNGIGVYFRTTQNSNGKPDGYLFHYDPSGKSGTFSIRKMVNGSQKKPIVSVRAADDYEFYGVERDVRVEVRGETFTAYVDGEKVLTATDSSYASGGIGLKARNKSVAYFDDVKVDLAD